MTILAPAKINLGLNIVGKREDGYHNLETVFYPVPINDEIEIIEPDKDNSLPILEIEGMQILGRVEDNLVVKAYKLLKSDFPQIPELCFHLKKRIPTQAGMGGGSADASYTLLLINKKFGLGLTDNQLEEYALKLGADCPFFVKSKPVFATGVGEILEPVNLDLTGKYICVVKPDISISTKEAFSLVKSCIPEKCCREIVIQPIETWKDELVNDFEVSAFTLYPELARIKQWLYDIGAQYAAMSGSGSAIFGIFDTKPEIGKSDYRLIVEKL